MALAHRLAGVHGTLQDGLVARARGARGQVAPGLDKGAAEFGADGAGLHEDDRDLVAELQAQGFRERDDRVLAGVVGARERNGEPPEHGGHLHDAAFALRRVGADEGQEGAGHGVEPDHIRLELGAQFIFGEKFQRSHLPIARVVHEADETERPTSVHGDGDGGRIRHIQREAAQIVAFRHFRQRIHLPRGRHDAEAAPPQLRNERTADAAGTTRDENPSAIHRSSLNGNGPRRARLESRRAQAAFLVVAFLAGFSAFAPLAAFTSTLLAVMV